MISVLVIIGKPSNWKKILEQSKAEILGQGDSLQMDGNLHAGIDLMKGCPNIQQQQNYLWNF